MAKFHQIVLIYNTLSINYYVEYMYNNSKIVVYFNICMMINLNLILFH